MSSLFFKLIQPVLLRSPFEINSELSDIKSGGLKYDLLMLIYTQLQKYQDIISPKDGVNKFLGEAGYQLNASACTTGCFIGEKPVKLIESTRIIYPIYRSSFVCHGPTYYML